MGYWDIADGMEVLNGGWKVVVKTMNRQSSEGKQQEVSHFLGKRPAMPTLA